jgi:hypothetical protein
MFTGQDFYEFKEAVQKEFEKLEAGSFKVSK